MLLYVKLLQMYLILTCWVFPLSDEIRCFDKPEGKGLNLGLKTRVFAGE